MKKFVWFSWFGFVFILIFKEGMVYEWIILVVVIIIWIWLFIGKIIWLLIFNKWKLLFDILFVEII